MTSNQEGLLTPAQVKAMQPAEMADFLRRNSGDANFHWQVREAILNRAAKMIDDLLIKLKAAAEAMVRSNHEIERLSNAHETAADPVEQRAKDRFCEVHNVDPRDVWAMQPEAIRESYRIWARGQLKTSAPRPISEREGPHCPTCECGMEKPNAS